MPIMAFERTGLNDGTLTIKASSELCEESGLVGVEKCIELVFTDPESRPGVRTFRKWQAEGWLPFRKVGRMVFFDPSEVRTAIDRFKVSTQ